MKTLDQIAAELQGYDPSALRADAVNQFLSRLVQPVQETETLSLFAALGRVLAADVVSGIDVPPHDNSAMDGYAFAGSQLPSATPEVPLALKVVGTAFAGKAWHGAVKTGECLKIMTGAVLPEGLDTVVPQELVATTATTTATPSDAPAITFFPQGLQPGDNRRLRGEDIRQGQVTLRKGEHLTPAALGLAASLGLKEVVVWRKLRVAYFSTGDEILSLGEPPREGAVYDSNRYTVFGLLTRLGVDVIDLGVVPDQPAALEAAFTHAAREADAIITSGGVSVGAADHTKAVMKKLALQPPASHNGSEAASPPGPNSGAGVAFWRIAMRPGRPMAVGRISRTLPVLGNKLTSSPRSICIDSYLNSSASDSPASASSPMSRASPAPTESPPAPPFALLFGLPGNPVAVMVTFLAFVRPALLQMMGSTAAAMPYLKAHSTAPIRKKSGRTEYQRGVVSTSASGQLQVALTGNQGSGVLSSMVQANGLIVLHHDQGNVAAGDSVDVMMFDGVI